MVAEYFHTVTLLAIDIRYVNHTDIHADIPYISCPLAVYKAIGMPVAKMAVQAVGITVGMAAMRDGRVRCPFRL